MVLSNARNLVTFSVISSTTTIFGRSFLVLDTDGDRRITLDEFTEAADLLALPRDAHDIFHEIDTNGGGMILFQEFVDWMATNEQKFESSDKNDIHDIEKQLDALASS